MCCFCIWVWVLVAGCSRAKGLSASAEQRYQDKLFKKNMEIAMLRTKVGIMSTLIGSSKAYKKAKEKGKATTDFFKALNYLTGKKMIDAIENASGNLLI